MLPSIISNKVQKSRQNIETYLSTNSQQQPLQQQQQQQQHQLTQQSVIPKQLPPAQSIARPSQQAPMQSSTTPIQNKNKNPKNEIQIKIMSVAGKQLSKEGMVLKLNKEQSRIDFYFEDDSSKMKLEVKKEFLSGKRVKPNYGEGSCVFEIGTGLLKREDRKQSSIKGVQTWTVYKEVKQYTIGIWLKDKDQLKTIMENSLIQSVADPNSSSNYIQIPKNVELQNNDEQAEADDDHSSAIRLSLPPPQKQQQTEKIRKIIKQMKQQDKNTVLLEIFKIKKQYQDPLNVTKRLKCPVHSCEKKSYKDIQQLKNHLKIKHPELSKHGIEMNDFDATFQCGSKALDLALFIGKMFPAEMKKIIKQMKTKQQADAG